MRENVFECVHEQGNLTRMRQTLPITYLFLNDKHQKIHFYEEDLD